MDYLGGVTSGYGVADVFSFPSAPNTTWKQTFLSADRSSWFWIPCDGFLGLAFSTIADANTSTLVETLMQDGLLDEPRFAIYYGKELNGTGDAAGEGVLTIGDSHEDIYVDGNLTWVEPLQRIDGEYQLWRTNMVSLAASTAVANGTTLNNFTMTSIDFANSWAVFDTGSGGITIPPSQVDPIYSSLGMNYTDILTGTHKPLCSEFNASWSVTFGFGNYSAPSSVTLRGDQLVRPGFANSEEYCWPPFDKGDVEGFFLFGTPFLHQLYAVYDFGGNDVGSYSARVGFGQLKEEWRPATK
jgi:saccharopepsin